MAAEVGVPYEKDERGVLAPEGGVKYPELNAPYFFLFGFLTARLGLAALGGA